MAITCSECLDTSLTVFVCRDRPRDKYNTLYNIQTHQTPIQMSKEICANSQNAYSERMSGLDKFSEYTYRRQAFRFTYKTFQANFKRILFFHFFCYICVVAVSFANNSPSSTIMLLQCIQMV